jgi:DNA repair protein RadC
VTLVHPRDVFRAAIRRNAVAVVLVHCHPSGDPEPSPEDLCHTQTLAQGAGLLGLVLEDHLIVGYDGFVSLRQKHPNLFTR